MTRQNVSERNIISNLLPKWLKLCLILTYGILILEVILLMVLYNFPEIISNVFVSLTEASSTPTIIPPTLTKTATNFPEPTATPIPEVGSTRLSVMDRMTMVYVPEGEFIMGADLATVGINLDELPAHKVYLDAYWINRTEVTNAMYAKFLNTIANHEEGGTFWLDV